MARKRITMQDIADACGMSRNTVSKIFNGRGAVPEGTRKLVLDKARELGYSQSPEIAGETARGGIALLTRHKLLSHNFGAFFITSFTDQICRYGYHIRMFEVSDREIAACQLPAHLDPGETAGILCIELFDREYLDMVCALGKPTVFVDGWARAAQSLLRCDLVSMESIASEALLVRQMLKAGARSIGFVGDREHCNSFYERWCGYSLALQEAGLSPDPGVCILEKDGEQYGDPDWLQEQLSAMPRIPDGFACANDHLAIHLMHALKRLGLRIPEDVMVTGFDGSLEASVVEPRLTTAQIPSGEIGRLTASLLAERIQSPEPPFRWTYVKTTPILGGSTR